MQRTFVEIGRCSDEWKANYRVEDPIGPEKGNWDAEAEGHMGTS